MKKSKIQKKTVGGGVQTSAPRWGVSGRVTRRRGARQADHKFATGPCSSPSGRGPKEQRTGVGTRARPNSQSPEGRNHPRPPQTRGQPEQHSAAKGARVAMGTAQTAPTRRRVTQAATEGHARRLPAVPGTAQSGRLRGGGRRTGGWRWGRAAGCAGRRGAHGL